MERNTKILLGVGAVIAAYLILKPKKAVGQPVANTSTPINKNVNDRLVGNCPEGFTYNSSLGCLPNTFLNRGNCNCIKAPCNCGADGVDLRALMSKQVYTS
jgi:hypothetical protein